MNRDRTGAREGWVNWVCFFRFRDEVSGSFAWFGLADTILSLGALLWLGQTLRRVESIRKWRGGRIGFVFSFVVILVAPCGGTICAAPING